ARGRAGARGGRRVRADGAQQEAEGVAAPFAPLALVHLLAAAIEPGDVTPAVLVHLAFEPGVAAQLRIAASKLGEPGDVLGERLVRMRPVEPGRGAVLAVGVVVAALAATDLVAPQQHGHA